MTTYDRRYFSLFTLVSIILSIGYVFYRGPCGFGPECGTPTVDILTFIIAEIAIWAAAMVFVVIATIISDVVDLIRGN